VSEETRFLDSIKSHPEDLVLRLVYADWLEELGDARSEYLRIQGKLQELAGSVPPERWTDESEVRQLRARLKKLARTLDAGWVAIFAALEPKFVRCRACYKFITAREAIDTNPRSFRRMKASRYCKSCYEDAVRARFNRGFTSTSRSRSSTSDYDGGPSDDD
jgi:uncharacterized protein (TIGR02996 family)